MKQRASTLWSMEGCTTSIVNHPAKMTMPLPDVSTKQTVTKQTVTKQTVTKQTVTMNVQFFKQHSQFTLIPTVVITYDRWLNGNYEVLLVWLNGGIQISF